MLHFYLSNFTLMYMSFSLSLIPKVFSVYTCVCCKQNIVIADTCIPYSLSLQLNTTYRDAQDDAMSYPFECMESDLSSLCNGWIQNAAGLVSTANTRTTAYIGFIGELTEPVVAQSEWLDGNIDATLQAVITPYLTQ